MKVGVIIFIVLICGVVLVECVSLIKTIADRVKKKKLAKEKQENDSNIVVSDNVVDTKEDK